MCSSSGRKIGEFGIDWKSGCLELTEWHPGCPFCLCFLAADLLRCVVLNPVKALVKKYIMIIFF